MESKKRSKIRKIITDIFLIIGITGIIILILEGGVRLFFPQTLRGEKLVGEKFSSRDEVLGYRYASGSKWRFLHPEYEVEYEINGDGFRDKKEYLMPKPDGIKRVLLIGDSFTFGQGVSYDKIWPVIVERQLEKAGYSHIELVKSGIQGLDTRSELILIQRLVEKYDCDIVVVGFLMNDLYTNSLHGIDALEETSLATSMEKISNGHIKDEKKKAEESWSQTMKKVFIRNSWQRNFHLLILAKRFVLSNDAMYSKFYLSAPNRGEWVRMPLSEKPRRQVKVTETLFKRIADYCQSLDKQFIVFSIPQQFQVLYRDESEESSEIDIDFYDRHFMKFARENGFTWVPTLDTFTDSRFKNDELFYRLDGHLNPKGNEVAAEVFIQKVVPLLQKPD